MPAQLSSVGIQTFAVFLFPRPSSSAQLCVDQHGCLMSLPSSHQTGEMEGKAPSASHGYHLELVQRSIHIPLATT